MKRIFFTLLALTLLLTACAPSATAENLQLATLQPSTLQPSNLVITDALERQVRLPAAPQRIVITGKGLFMIADAAYIFPGVADKIVGLGNAGQGASNFISMIDPNYVQKATLANDASTEQIAALHPDLVILKSYLAESMGKPIETLGIPVVYVDFETPEQYNRDLLILGKVFGDEARAAKIV